MPSHKKTPETTAHRLHALALGLALALVPLAAQAVDPKAAKYYEDALVRYEKKDLDGAIIQLKNALQIDKDMLPVQMLLGKALLQNGDVLSAEVALQEALRLGVNRAEVIIPLGQAYMAQGKHRLIFEQQQFNLQGLPPATQVQLLCLRASASADLGDLRAAIKSVNEARAIDPRAPITWLTEVPIRIRERQLKEATDAADQAVALSPDSAEAWYQKGSVLHAFGNLAGAVSTYDRALKQDADHVETRVARAGLLIDLARIPEAAKDLEHLLRISPFEPRAAYLRALLAERDNKPEVARAALKDVTGLVDPVPLDFIRYRPQLLMLNGLAHFGLNEREKAKQYLEYFQKAQGNTPASKLLAQIYLSDGNTERAIEVLETYLKSQPGDGQALILLGRALINKGQHVRAASLMQQALQTKDLPQFRTVLGLSLLRSGQTGNAITELESAFKGDPTQTQAATSLVGLYLRSNQSQKAAEIADRLVKQQPANWEFQNLLGMARAQAGNAPAARAAFEQAIKLNDSAIGPKLNMARLELATKAYDAAAARLNALLKADDKNPEIAFELAALAEARGQAAEAQRWLEKANDLSGPKETRWSLALSEFHLRNGRASQALEAAKRASSKAPDDLTVLMALARAQMAMGDTTAAKSSLTAATRLADYNPQLQVQIASMQLLAKNPSGANYSLDKALSNQPDYLPALALMTEVELRQGDVAKAEKRARDVLAKAPGRAIGHSLLGDVAMAKNQPAAAVESYRKAFDAEGSTTTLLQLTRSMYAKGDGKAALRVMEQWVAGHPNDLTAQKALSDGHARAGNYPQAKAGYEAVLKINRDDVEALNNLANVQLITKDFAAAIKTSELALSKSPGNPLIIDTLGWALFQTNQVDKALQFLRDARLRQPGNPEIRYHLAAALAKTGRKNEAKEELEAALKTGNRFEGAAEAAKLLASLK